MKLVLAITGASGAIYAKQFLDVVLPQKQIELHVVASNNAQRIFKEELDLDLKDYCKSLNLPQNFDVPYVSGSARMDAMVILPCSTGTLGRIAHGISNDAISRAADVFLKEKRQLIITPREMPLNLIQLRNLTTLAEAGATIIPSMPTFYSGQKSMTEVTFTVVSRILDHLNIPHESPKRWHD